MKKSYNEKDKREGSVKMSDMQREGVNNENAEVELSEKVTRVANSKQLGDKEKEEKEGNIFSKFFDNLPLFNQIK